MESIRRLLSGNFGRRGLPFFLIVAGGSFALSQVTDARYTASQHKKTLGLTKDQMRARGWKEDTTDIVEEYQKMKETMDLDNWENIRGPRPWEEDNQKYVDLINKRVEETMEKRKKTGSFWSSF